MRTERNKTRPAVAGSLPGVTFCTLRRKQKLKRSREVSLSQGIREDSSCRLRELELVRQIIGERKLQQRAEKIFIGIPLSSGLITKMYTHRIKFHMVRQRRAGRHL